MNDFVLGRLKTAIGLGQLFGEGASFITDLRGPESEGPSAGHGVQFLGLRAEALGFAAECAPDDASDAGSFCAEADPESLVADEAWGNGGEEPIQFITGVEDRPVAALSAGRAFGAIDEGRFENISIFIKEENFSEILGGHEGEGGDAADAENADGGLSDGAEDGLRGGFGTKFTLESAEGVEKLGANSEAAIAGGELAADTAEFLIGAHQSLLI
jgi:hypothetical protein